LAQFGQVLEKFLVYFLLVAKVALRFQQFLAFVRELEGNQLQFVKQLLFTVF
jgi:hypothetical protein